MATGEGTETFNPQVQPTQDPNFIGWSRPAQRTIPDVSGETLFKGIGSAINTGATVADDFVKKGIIEPQVEQQAGAIRDSFVDSLNTANTQLAQTTLPKNSLTKDPETPSKDNIPNAVSGIGKQAQTLQGALDSGHISETYYYGQLNSLAKSMRAQYPGYRDYIDQELGRVTGVHPANTYIRSLVGDMNRQQSEQKSAQDKTQELIREGVKEGIPHMADWGDAFAAGKVNQSQIMHYYDDAMAFKYQHARDDAAYTQQTHSREDDSRYYTDTNTSLADRAVDSVVNLPITLAGHTPGSLLQIAQRQSGGEAFGDEDWTHLGMTTQANLMTARAQVENLLKTDSGNGMSYGARMGMKPAEQEEWIKARLAPIQTQLEAIGGKDLHMMAGNAELNKAQVNDGIHQRLLDPKSKDLAVGLSMAKQMGGEGLIPLMTDQFQKNGALSTVAGWMDGKALNAVTQPKASQGIFSTMFGDINEGQQKKIDERAYTGLTENLKVLNAKDTSIQAKVNAAHYYFDAANGHLMDPGVLKEDTVDAQGNKIEGKYKLYPMLYNDTNSRSLFKLQHDSGDPNVYSKYTASAEENGFRLFGDKIKDLDFISKERAGPQTSYTFKYSDGKITAIDKSGTDVGNVTGRFKQPSYVQDTVNKINIMLAGLKSVYKPINGDTDAFVLQSLDRLGINKENMSGLTGQLVDAIMASRGPKPTGGKDQDKVNAR